MGTFRFSDSAEWRLETHRAVQSGMKEAHLQGGVNEGVNEGAIMNFISVTGPKNKRRSPE